MKKIHLFLVILLFCGCNNNSYRQVNKKQALKLIDEQEAVLVDVRSIIEYNDGHIENAVSFPVTTIIENVEDKYDENTYLIVYCKSGKRSKVAVDGLIELGYKYVYDLGSIDNWN